MVVLGLLTRPRPDAPDAPRADATKRAPREATFDCLLAASIASWGLLGVGSAAAAAAPVRWSIALLHLAVAFLLLGRSRPSRRASPSSMLLSLPALAAGGCAFLLAAPPSAWSAPAQALFLLGLLLTLYALATLGRHFAFFPAVRGVTTRGPYRWLRHPANSGELLMIAACAFSRPTPVSVAVAATALPLVGLRVRAEEALLVGARGYRDYADRVRYRLIPGVW